MTYHRIDAVLLCFSFALHMIVFYNVFEDFVYKFCRLLGCSFNRHCANVLFPENLISIINFS